MFNVGEGNFLKEVFLPPHPYPSRTLKLGFYFFAVIPALNRRTHNVRTTPKCESFGQAFSKACGFGQRP